MKIFSIHTTGRLQQAVLAAVGCLLITAGCGPLISSVTSDMASDMSHALLNNNDLKTVEQGTPAYLLMIDGFLESDPDNESLLISAAKLHSSYAMFANDPDRKRRLTRKGLEYALRAVCVRDKAACDIRKQPFDQFTDTVSRITLADAPAYYALGAAWAAWIESDRQNWDAVAEISRVETIMEKIIELDDDYNKGGAHMYLGVINTLIPAAMGGNPEEGRNHFEKALSLFGGDLMVKVLYARYYARMIFDRDLHDRLLTEVLDADPNVPGYVSSNLMAREMAGELLKTADDYF